MKRINLTPFFTKNIGKELTVMPRGNTALSYNLLVIAVEFDPEESQHVAYFEVRKTASTTKPNALTLVGRGSATVERAISVHNTLIDAIDASLRLPFESDIESAPIKSGS